MKYLSGPIAAALIASLLGVPAVAQQSEQTTTLELEGKPLENLSELTPGRSNQRLTEFLRGTTDGVVKIVGGGESARMTKKGDRVEIVQDLTVQDAYDRFLVPQMLGLLAECRHNLRNIGIASEMYSSDSDSKFPESLSKLVPTHLFKIPRCPVNNTEYTYQREIIAGKLDHFVIRCQGDHAGVQVAKGYPRYDSIVGPITDEFEQERADQEVRDVLYRYEKAEET